MSVPCATSNRICIVVLYTCKHRKTAGSISSSNPYQQAVKLSLTHKHEYFPAVAVFNSCNE